jgi:hemerythrin-like domain-containing protein
MSAQGDDRLVSDRLEDVLARLASSLRAGDGRAARLQLTLFAAALERYVRSEERWLFPTIERMTPTRLAPTAKLRREHRSLRTLVAAIRDALDGAAPHRGLDAVGSLQSLFRLHVTKEEWTLEPLLGRLGAVDARAEIEAQHDALRGMMERCDELAAAFDAGDGDLLALGRAVAQLRTAFRAHRAYEDRYLKPALRAAAPSGALRLDGEAPPDRNGVRVPGAPRGREPADAVRDVIATLRAHLDAEEHELLAAVHQEGVSRATIAG